MPKQTAFMKSRFPRVPGDYYPTIDTRTVDGLITFYRNYDLFLVSSKIISFVDMCAPQGSGIVDHLLALGQDAYGVGDAFAEDLGYATIGVTNPPYKIKQVNPILRRQIQRVAEGELLYFSALLRTNFDHASTRVDMFRDCPYYFGQLKLLFRPWWTDSREFPPFHQFVWHTWTHNKRSEKFGHINGHIVDYYDAPYDPRYVADVRHKKTKS